MYRIQHKTTGRPLCVTVEDGNFLFTLTETHLVWQAGTFWNAYVALYGGHRAASPELPAVDHITVDAFEITWDGVPVIIRDRIESLRKYFPTTPVDDLVSKGSFYELSLDHDAFWNGGSYAGPDYLVIAGKVFRPTHRTLGRRVSAELVYQATY